MWIHEHVAETAATPQQVWQVLSDLDNWGAWDTSMEWVRLEGPFAVGSEVVMKPTGQDPITSTITAVDPNSRYADETEFGGVLLRFSHTLEPLDADRTRVTHRLEITGEGADDIGPNLGPQIVADFPDAMQALLASVDSTRSSNRGRLAVLGSGPVGRALAAGFAAAGHRVTLGSRTPSADLHAWAEDAGLSVASSADAVRGVEIVLNATPGRAAIEAVTVAGADGLDGVVLLDVSNPLDLSRDAATVFTGVDDSIGERLQRAFPRLRVVKSLCTVNNAVMVNPALLPEPTTMFLAGNDHTAKNAVRSLLRTVGWLDDHILDIGDIDAARSLELNILFWLRISAAVAGDHFNIRVVRAERPEVT